MTTSFLDTLSTDDFLELFDNEEACRECLFRLRWPTGFLCPRCGCEIATRTRRGLWLCRSCRHQASITAGTIFQGSHLPLTKWFEAMWYVTETDGRVDVAELQRMLGLGSYKTAWAVVRKLARLVGSVFCERLSGTVEVTHIVRRVRENEGTSESRAWIIMAGETQPQVSQYRRIHVSCLDALSSFSVERFMADAVEVGSLVRTHASEVYAGLTGYVHEKAADNAFGENIRESLNDWLDLCEQGIIAGTDLSCDAREFMIRFNRFGFDLERSLFERVVQQSIRQERIPFSKLSETDLRIAAECLTKKGKRDALFQLLF